ncbi:MAG: hypothetical protein WCG93_10150 [Paludibacter sp.]
MTKKTTVVSTDLLMVGDPTTGEAKYIEVADLKIVKSEGNETIAGTKTFSASPIVPTPTEDGGAVNKGMLDAKNLSIEKKLYSYSKNKFDKNAIISDYYLSGNVIHAIDGFWISDYIDCEAGVSEIANHVFSFISFFDAARGFISETNVAGQTLITPPEGAKLFRISNNSDANTFQVEEGSVSTSFVPFSKTAIFENKNNKINAWSENPSTDKFPSEALIAPTKDIVNSFFGVSQNLFDKNSITADTYLNCGNGTLNSNSAFWTTDFIPVIESETYICNRDFSFICFFGAANNFLSGIAAGGQTTINTPAGCSFIRVSQGYPAAEVQIEIGSVSTPYTAYKESYMLHSFSPRYIDITATRNVADFNSIREIINTITDASESKIYRIHVPIGRWFECDLQGKEFVEIIGSDKLGTVLYCDGTSTKLTPTGYSAGASGVPLNTIEQWNKHCIRVLNDIVVKTLTIEVNDAKYCAHLDSNTYATANFSEVVFHIFNNVNFCIGIGIHGFTVGQKLKFSGCDFIREDVDGLGVFIHNWNNQSFPTELTIENSHFKNCGYLTIDELGSGQDDKVNLINCDSNIEAKIEFMVDVTGDHKTYWINPATGTNEPNPQNVPYCLKLNAHGTKISSIYSLTFPYGGYGLSRPLFLNSINGDVFEKFHFSNSQTAPSTSTSTGAKGEIRIVGGYIYYCIATNSWNRSALTW